MNQEIANTQKQEVGRQNGGEPMRVGPVFRPPTDIYESDDKVVIVADLPGVAPQDLDVTLERRVLTIRGSVRAPAPGGYRQVYAEYGVGDFERTFALSDDIDRDQIEARQTHGVLTLELPKSATTRPRKIEVHT